MKVETISDVRMAHILCTNLGLNFASSIVNVAVSHSWCVQ